MFIDSHVHLTHHLFDGIVPCIDSSKADERIIYKDRDALIEKMKEDGIGFCVEPGIELESNYKILRLAEAYSDFLYPAIGVHPTRTPQTKWSGRKEIGKLADHDRVVAIGELGLDYHLERKNQHRLKQKAWFVWQLLLADKKQLPLILHIRLADEDAIRILRRFRKRIHGGVCHCFNRGLDVAKIYVEEFGFLLGIGGSLLQEQCAELENAVKNIPLEYLLLETDAPYVKPDVPEGLSGKKWKKARNTSLILPDVAMRIAEIKGISVEEVEKVTADNAMRLFQLHLTNVSCGENENGKRTI